MTADAVLSNRARRDQRKRATKPARRGKGMTVTSPAQVAAAKDVPTERDGLKWLLDRNRLTPIQAREARGYREDFRDAAAAGVTIKSGLDFQEGRSTGSAPAGPAGHIVGHLDAQRRLFRKRFEVLQGQATALELLDGVCGRGLTLTTLAGGDDRMAKAYELVLKVALDMLAAAGVR